MLRVQVGKNETLLQLLILDIEDNDVLLGLDWFLITGCLIVPAKRILKFPCHTVSLELENGQSDDELVDDDKEDILISEVIDENDLIEDDWPLNGSNPNISINPADKLNENEYKLFRKSLGYTCDLFAYSIKDLKLCNKGKHIIKLSENTPIRQNPYRTSYKEREIIQKEVNEMIENGIIEPSTSPWASSVIIIPKPDGSRRFCVDYRKLNKVTVTESWPIPRIEDILDRLSGSNFFLM